jgi:hypothetical protein
MANYVDSDVLQSAGIAPESDDAQMWDRLGRSRLASLDRECEVPDNFFEAAPDVGDEITKSFRTNGTQFLAIGPYITDSITEFTIDSADRLADGTYHENDGFIVFDTTIPSPNLVARVTARFGFSVIPADIVAACLEQALFMWRRKDQAFTELSGVSSAVITAQFSPSFGLITKRYRGRLFAEQLFCLMLVFRTIHGTIMNAQGVVAASRPVFFEPVSSFGSGGDIVPRKAVKCVTDANGYFTCQILTTDAPDGYARYKFTFPNGSSFLFDLIAGNSVTIDELLNLSVTSETSTQAAFENAINDAVDGVQFSLESDPSPTLSADLDLNGNSIMGQLENSNFVLDGGLLG